MAMPMEISSDESFEESEGVSGNPDISIMVNGCSSEMIEAIVKAAEPVGGLYVLPISFRSEEVSGQIFRVHGRNFFAHGPSKWESVLKALLQENPNLTVVDCCGYSMADPVNANAELYCKVGVPFVMWTRGNIDTNQLRMTLEASKVSVFITPQMGKQVVAFRAAMHIMAETFPGAFSGYKLEVADSHQGSQVDPCETAKAVVSCFNKLGMSLGVDEIEKIREPSEQLDRVGISEEHLSDHGAHVYYVEAPDIKASFVFQHNVCGRSVYAEGVVDAVVYLAKKINSKDNKKIYKMVDLLREGIS